MTDQTVVYGVVGGTPLKLQCVYLRKFEARDHARRMRWIVVALPIVVDYREHAYADDDVVSAVRTLADHFLR